ncbi:hypothetical protein [Massilia sp. S19_KUP03_FR1]|uniref:hypothetical protein n=1 Tax=Massilia sp. S19_KUP03_FR1 TaxID=3025503 RepID=UPI002FCCFB4C
MAHAIEVHLSANVEKFNQGMAAAKKTTTENVGFIASIFNTVKSYFAGMWDSAKSFFSNLGDKAGAAWGSFKDSASGALEKVLSMLPGVGKATKDIGDEAEQSDKKTDSWLSKLGSALTAVIGIAVAAAAAIGALAAKGLLIDAAFAKISVSTDMGAGSLSKFQDAAKRSGMSVGDLGTSVKAFQDAMKEAAAGTGGKVFADLGVSVKNSGNELLATDSTLIDFARHIAAMSSETEKYDAAAKAGFGGKVQLLEDIAHAGALVSGTTDDQAAAVVRLQKIWHEVLPGGKSMWEDISTSLSNKLTPALTTASVSILEAKNKIMDAFAQIYGGGSLFDKLTDKIAGWANSMAGYFSDVVKKATEAGVGLAGYIAKATGLGGALKTAPSAGYVPGATPLTSGTKATVTDAAMQKQIDAYNATSLAIKAQNDATREEIATGQALTAARREQIVLAAGVRDGTVKLSMAQYWNRMEELAGQDALQKAAAAAKDARSTSEAAAKKEADQYAAVSAAIASKIAENKLELLTGAAVTESQKLAIKIDADQASGKKALSAAHLATAKAALVELDASEKLVAQAKAQKEVAKYVDEGTTARSASRNALEAEYQSYGKSADAVARLMVAVNAETDMQKELDKLRQANLPISGQTIKQLEAERDLRTEVGQATLGQSNALKYATQLADENKKFAAESIYDEKGRAAALLAIDAKIWQDRIKLAGDGTEAQKALKTQYDIWYSNQSLKPQIDEQRKMWDSIESTAHDTFVSIFDSGKSAFDRLRDTLKNGLLDLLYQMVIKKWVLNIGASVGLTSASGLAEAAGAAGGTGTTGATGLIGIAQTASNMYKAITGGFEALGDGVAGYVQQGLSAAGYTPTAASGLSTAGGQALTPFASQVGQVAGAAAAYAAGSALNKAISGQYSTGSGFMTAQKVATAVASYVNPVLGVAVGAISGLINRAFGMGSTEVKSQGLSGTLSASGVSGNTYQNLHQDGGWFRSDKNWTDKTALTPEVTAQFTQGFEAIKTASAGFATSVGASVDNLSAYSKTFDIKLTSDATANEKAISDFFLGVGDEIALRLVPGLAQFNKSGETMATTLQRLAGDFDATNQVAMLLGKNGTSMFGSLTISSAAARERLIELAGGVSNLTSQATAFAQNYLTEAERLKPVADAVAAAMASLGLASVTTREQFKTVVQGLDVTTAAGAQQFASMMALSDAFAQVHPAIEATTAALRTEADVLNERKDLQKQLDQLTLTSLQLRAKERTAIDASNVALFDQITALQNAASLSDTLKTSVTSLDAFRKSIKSFSDSQLLGSLSPLTAMQKDAEAKSQYEAMLAKAKAGDETARSGITGAATAFLTADQIVNASSAAYIANFAKVQSDLAALDAIAGAQMTDAQQQLAALDQQVSQLASLNATASSIEAALTMPTPVLNWSEVGTTNMAPLTEEIKGLRADNDELRADNAALLAAINRQTDAVVQATLTAAANNAQAVTAGAEQAQRSGNWAQNLIAEVTAAR